MAARTYLRDLVEKFLQPVQRQVGGYGRLVRYDNGSARRSGHFVESL
jgi:hypothetical protein